MYRELLLLVSAYVALGCCSDDLVVNTTYGQLRGSLLQSRLGKKIYSFRGVPFAKPPVGNLRFQPPVPPDSWDGVRNAISDSPACLQPSAEPGYEVSEDCLYLNVYSTKLPTTDTNPKRPVLVFFHAGGWYSVTGISYLYGPQYFMDQDIVLVTTNYRLGSLGFLATNDGVMKGNNGMKDMVATLRWVQKNIEAFGGDPNNVTIGGYSVGGASVWMHMFSPMCEGLFHKAISMSSSINTFWNVDDNPSRLAERQAELLDCPTTSSQAILDCLKEKDAQAIASTFAGMKDWGYEPVLVWTPVLEPDYGDGTERYLIQHPRDLLLAGNFTKVPWMTGQTTDEFAYDAYDVLRNETLTKDLNDNFEYVAPIAFMYERGTERSHNISKSLRKFYLGDKPITTAVEKDLGNLYSDAIIGYGEDFHAKLISTYSNEPVYFYRFSYQGRYSHVYYPNTTIPFGVMHHDDLIYLFYISAYFPYFHPGDPEIKTVERLTTMWANFVQTGSPIPNESTFNVSWPPMKVDDLNYMDIGEELVLKKGLYQDRKLLWESLFPLNVTSSTF